MLLINPQTGLGADALYEVLLTSQNNNGSYNIKPFGIKFNKDGQIEITIFPNKTLKNIKNNPFITIQFTQNIDVYVRALFNKLVDSDFLDDKILNETNTAIDAKVVSMTEEVREDAHSKTTITHVVCDIIDVSQINLAIPVISRPTAMIMEDLIRYSRVKFMNVNEMCEYLKDMEDSIDFIKDQGNKIHLDAINLICSELENKIKKKKENRN